MEMVVEPNINVVRGGILIEFATKLGNGSNGVSTRRNLSQSLALPTAIIKVVGIPQMVFTNSITTTRVNMTADQPPMNSMVVGRCRCCAFKRRISRTNCCNYNNSWSKKWPLC